jgi:hypothetical protein
MINELQKSIEKRIETLESSFEKASREIENKGYRIHEQNHDEGGIDPKIYHISEHPKILKLRAELMIAIFNLSPKQRVVIEMAIAWHDTIINYDKPDPDNLLGMIRRRRGAREGDMPNEAEGNEGQSGKSLEQEMLEVNRIAKKEIFTEEQIINAVWGVHATYPDVNFGKDFKGAKFEEYPYYNFAVAQNQAIGRLFEWLKTQNITKGLLFFQPHLEIPLEQMQKVPKEVLIVALSDLGGAGMAGKEAFFKEGDDEMRELYYNLLQPDIMYGLINGDGEQDQFDRKEVADAFFKWLENQIGFVAWQALRFEKILHLLKKQDDISPAEEEKLRFQFSHFEDNVRATCDRTEKLKEEFKKTKSNPNFGEAKAFLNLAQTLGYGNFELKNL